ncbi:hypothetical protein [Tsukamurella sp. NPDC003166]|uniref:hypothetical protein n=1 Tax=Tsukamurella sp. NPDC003166 TaxID=3154444 RepID=UPI0033A759C2
MLFAIAAAFVLVVAGAVAGTGVLPAASALPCPDGSQTCGPTPTTDPGPTQGNQVPTTAPQAPQTTIPPNIDTGAPSAPTQGNGTFQGTVQSAPTADNPNGCIVNCNPTQPPTPNSTSGQDPTTAAAPSGSETSPQSREVVYRKCIQAAMETGRLSAAVISAGAGRDPVGLHGICEDCIAKTADKKLADIDESTGLKDCRRTGMSPMGPPAVDASPARVIKSYGPSGPNPRTIGVTDQETSIPGQLKVDGGLNLGPFKGGVSYDLPAKTFGKLTPISITVSQGEGKGQAPEGSILQAVPYYADYIISIECRTWIGKNGQKWSPIAVDQGQGSWGPYVSVPPIHIGAPVGYAFIAIDPISGKYVIL